MRLATHQPLHCGPTRAPTLLISALAIIGCSALALQAALVSPQSSNTPLEVDLTGELSRPTTTQANPLQGPHTLISGPLVEPDELPKPAQTPSRAVLLTTTSRPTTISATTPTPTPTPPKPAPNNSPSPPPVIVMDVSHPPTTYQPPQTTASPTENVPVLQTTTINLTSSTPVAIQPHSHSTESKQPDEAPALASLRSASGRSTQQEFSRLVEEATPASNTPSATTEIPPLIQDTAFAPTTAPQPQMPASPTTTTANLITPTPAPASAPSNVQILRPKSRLFKCHQQTNPCQNGGLCFNGTCFCPQGYTGESCAINIDECRLTIEPCYNGGQCFDEVDAFRCVCAPGFKGERCQEAVDMCSDRPCHNDAKCINHRTDFTCQCKPGWEGKNCSLNINECLVNPCKNNATCSDEINDYRCDCGLSGYTGKDCDINIDDCAARPCSIGAERCEDLVADFRCICHEGWEGKRCEFDVAECQVNPCENNGVCRENSHLFNLTRELSLVDTGSRADAPPLNMSQYAGFTCECTNEYFGDRCEEKKKCFTEPSSQLCNHKDAECVNVGNSYECLINASFDGSGRNYAKYQSQGQQPFRMREIYFKYRSLEGGLVARFEVSQPDQWSLIELHLNKSGAYLTGPAIKRDEDMFFDQLSADEYRLNLSAPLDVRSLTLAPASMATDYQSPFHGCLIQIRLNNQLVPFLKYGPANNGSSILELVENHLEVGHCRTCFEKDCMNGGHCEYDRDTSYDHCSCPMGFQGTNCESDVNECLQDRSICLNGAQCENTHGGFRCNCKEGYKGDKCQELADHCKALKPCGPGTCRSNSAKNVGPGQPLYLCDCPSSHIGKRCERRRDCNNECSAQHAHCVSNVTCACLPGSSEQQRSQMCEFVSSCQQVQGELCMNGGICRDMEPAGYECICPEPFYGPICQHYVEKPQLDLILLIVVACIAFLMAACTVVSFVIFRSVRKARATRGTYSPSTQEKFGNSASDLLKPPQPERLI